MGRKEQLKASDALAQIAAAMSGVKWDRTVANNVADILFASGHELADVDPKSIPPAKCPACGRGELCVLETYTAYHPYDAQRHITTNAVEHELDSLSDGDCDYRGHCLSCKFSGPIQAFGMEMLNWLDAEDGDDD